MPAQHSALHRCTLGSRPGRGNANLQLGADLKRSNHLALVSVHGKFATQNPSSEDPRSLFQKYETLKAQRFCTSCYTLAQNALPLKMLSRCSTSATQLHTGILLLALVLGNLFNLVTPRSKANFPSSPDRGCI